MNKMIRTAEDLAPATAPLSLKQLQRLNEGYNFATGDAAMSLTFNRMLDEAEHAERAAALTPRLRAMLDDLAADEAAELREHYASLIVTASRTLQEADDVLVIGDPATFGKNEFDLDDEPDSREREKLKFEGHGFFGCHWVPRDVAEDALKRVRSGQFSQFQFSRTPRDLLAALRSRGAFSEHRESEVLLGQSSTGKVMKERTGGGLIVESLLEFARRAVEGCQDAHVLRGWLAAALKGDEQYYAAFAAKVRAELKTRGEPEVVPDDDEDAEQIEDVDVDTGEEEDDSNESPAAASDALEQSATAPNDVGGE